MTFPTSKFDFIVIGAGSAGSIIACELAKNRAYQVLLLESGTRSTHRNSRVPAFYPHLFGDDRFCHPTSTVPQSGLANRRIALPRGKGLGGSSLINAMIWLPPHQADLMRWSEETQCSWDTAAMQLALAELDEAYFGYQQLSSKCENQKDSKLESISTEPWLSSSVRAFVNMARIRGGEVFPYTRSIRQGRRQTAWQTFRERPIPSNLTIATGFEVQRIVTENATATGVIVRNDTQLGEVSLRATRGVLLCAGALASPCLLQRSGIGPREVLKDAGIEVRIENAHVGQNLQDHLIFPVVMSHDLGAIPHRPDKSLIAQAVRSGTGPLTSNVAEAGGLFRITEDQSILWDKPSENRATNPSSSTTNHAVSPRPEFQWHITPTHYLEYPIREQASPAFSIGVTPLHPQSRGYVRVIKKQDNALSIEIDPCYLTAPADREQFVKAVQCTRQWIGSTTPPATADQPSLDRKAQNSPLPSNGNLADVDNQLTAQVSQESARRELLPGNKRVSNEQVAACLTRFSTTLYHYVGTCRVGTNEKKSVCSPDFQVHGCKNLYVCDGSVLPSLPSGNTQVAIMMIARMLVKQLG